LRYSFVGAKLESFDYSTDIGSNKVFSASFKTEIDPDDQSKGFFMSGVLGAEKVEDFILLEGTPSGIEQDGFYALQETSGLFVTNLIPTY